MYTGAGLTMDGNLSTNDCGVSWGGCTGVLTTNVAVSVILGMVLTMALGIGCGGGMAPHSKACPHPAALICGMYGAHTGSSQNLPPWGPPYPAAVQADANGMEGRPGGVAMFALSTDAGMAPHATMSHVAWSRVRPPPLELVKGG